jgi:hypothetical protein
LKTPASESLHRSLEALGIPVAELHGRPFDDLDAAALESALRYLEGKGLIDMPEAARPPLVSCGERALFRYRSRGELFALALTFLGEGVRDLERCVWVLPEEASSEARQAFGRATYGSCSPDQLEILPWDEWMSDPNVWLREERHALAEGYRALRLCAEGRGFERALGAHTRLLNTCRL